MKRMLFAAAALAAVCIGANARDDRLPAKFVGDWCLAEHTADHLAFYRRGRYANPDNVDDWLTINGYCSEHLNIARHGDAGKGAPNCQSNLEAVIRGYGTAGWLHATNSNLPSRLRSMCLVRST